MIVSMPDAETAPEAPDAPALPRSRSLMGRLGPRVVVFPLIVLVVAWMLQTRNAAVEQQRVATIVSGVEGFIAAATAGDPPSADLSAAAPGLLEPAADIVREIAADAAGERLLVTVERGDAGPGHPSAGTHTATILRGGSPRLHLRVGVTGDRTVLAGWWRPAAAP